MFAPPKEKPAEVVAVDMGALPKMEPAAGAVLPKMEPAAGAGADGEETRGGEGKE